TIGLLILVFMLFLAIEPPAWVQIVIGVGLAAGGAGLSWAIAAGLGRRPGATRRVAESGESTTRRKGRSA
ncbi:MAG TPA: hypothetical protein VFK89_07090, partial [Actinomycetota bacterium]|nr:hypothetical protein [Actinomycetota bacterium]